jgi:hypothetical protein
MTKASSLSADQLAEIEQAVKTVFESGVLSPHEKQHLWEVRLRVSAKFKELAAQPEQAG